MSHTCSLTEHSPGTILIEAQEYNVGGSSGLKWLFRASQELRVVLLTSVLKDK